MKLSVLLFSVVLSCGEATNLDVTHSERTVVDSSKNQVVTDQKPQEIWPTQVVTADAERKKKLEDLSIDELSTEKQNPLAVATSSAPMGVSLEGASEGQPDTDAVPSFDAVKLSCKDLLCLKVTGQNLEAIPPFRIQIRSSSDLDAPIFGEISVDLSQKNSSTYKFERGAIVIPILDRSLQKFLELNDGYVYIFIPQSSTHHSFGSVTRKTLSIVFEENFDFRTVGILDDRMLDEIFFQSNYGALPGWRRSQASRDSSIVAATNELFPINKVLSAKNSAGAWGPVYQNGTGGLIAFTSFLCKEPPCKVSEVPEVGKNATRSIGFEELVLEYSMKVDSHYDTGPNAKIPGFGGGATGVSSGGGLEHASQDGIKKTYSPNGRNAWSARPVFQNTGVVQYVYHVDMLEGSEAVPYPRTVPLAARRYGHAFQWLNEDGTRFLLEKDKWHRIQQRVKMNTLDATGSGKFDGIVEVHVDGKRKLLIDKIRFRHRDPSNTSPFDIEKTLDIDALMFHNFYGGSGPQYATQKDVEIQFDDILIFQPHPSEVTQ